MRLALVGLAGSGKTCVFNALTGSHEAPGAGGGRSAEHVAVLRVPDPRLDWLAEQYRPPKVTPATIEVLDLPGLGTSGASGGPRSEGTIGSARSADALALVLRGFRDPSYPHERPEPDPRRDLENLRSELLLADLGVAEKRVERLRKEIAKPRPERERDRDERERAHLERIVAALGEGRRVREVEATPEERRLTKGYAFLSEKPWIALLSRDEGFEANPELPGVEGRAEMLGRLEMEIGELEEAEREPFMREMGLERLHTGDVVRAFYDALDIVTFLTCGDPEVHAWTVPRGATAVEAAGTIHSDLARGFIRAEVVAFEELRAAGSMKAVKAAGRLRLEGRDYVVADGDVILVRFSV
jgi:GTP-binding protein YchF